MVKLRIIATLLIIMGCFFLFSGCKDRNASKDQEPEIVNISFVYPRDGSGVLQKLTSSFNLQNPYIQVRKQEGGRSSDYLSGLKIAFEAGEELPDILLLHDTWISYFANAGYIKEIENISTSTHKNEFIPGMIAAATVDDVVFGLPLWVDTLMLYYRKDLIEAPPTSWTELESISRSLAKERNIPYQMLIPANSKDSSAYFAASILSSFDALPDFRDNPIQIKGKNTLEALTALSRMVQKDTINVDILGMDAEGCRIQFERGNALFMLNWSYARKFLNREDSPIYGKVGIAAIPTKGGDPSNHIISGWVASMGNGSSNSAETLKFLEYLAGSKAQMRIAVDGGMMPARMGLYNQTDWQRAMDVSQTMGDIFTTGQPLRTGNYFNKQMDILANSITRALKDKKAPEKLFSEMQEGFKDLTPTDEVSD